MRILGALAFSVGYVLLRVSWALGGRWGYSACDRAASPGADELATGCHAATAELSFWQGWGAVVLGGVLVATAAAVSRRPARVTRAAAWAAGAALVTVSFPLHLLFQIPAGIAGRPTDWLDVSHRLVLVAGGVLFAVAAAAAAPPRIPGSVRDDGPRPVPRWVRAWAYAGVAVPVLGWTLPHGLWMLGVPFGISTADLAQILRDTGPMMGPAIAVVPGIASLLTLGLAHRWGQVIPGWVPVLAGRRVPRHVVLVSAGLVAMALVTYGALSVEKMLGDLATGAADVADLASGWAVTATLLVFLGWGVTLGVTTVGYHLVTRPRYLSASSGPPARSHVEPSTPS